MKTLFISCAAKIDLNPVLKKALRKLAPYDRIGVFTTSQHLHEMDSAKRFFEENKKEVVIGGQVLGCNAKKADDIADDVDAILYVGSGKFHPGAFMETEKKTFIANPYSLEVSEVTSDEREAWRKKQNARIRRAIAAKTFGILVSTKTGQMNLRMALSLKDELESAGRTALLFTGEEINPDRLIGYKIDAWVNTACPRIVEDNYDKPILNPGELRRMLELL